MPGAAAHLVRSLLVLALVKAPLAAYVPRFESEAVPVRPAAVFAAFARGEMKRFTFESAEMQAEVHRLIVSDDVDDDYVNAMRGAVLGLSRFQILRHIPADTQWYRMKVHPLLLASLRTPIAWNEEEKRCQTVGLGFRDLETRSGSFQSEHIDRYMGIFRNARNVERVVIAGAIDFDDEAMFLVDGNHRSLAFYSRARIEPIPVVLYVGISPNFERAWLGNTYLDCLHAKLPVWAEVKTAPEGSLKLHSALKALDTKQVHELAAANFTTRQDGRDNRNMTALGIALVSLSPEIIRATIQIAGTPANDPIHVPVVPGYRMDQFLHQV